MTWNTYIFSLNNTSSLQQEERNPVIDSMIRNEHPLHQTYVIHDLVNSA